MRKDLNIGLAIGGVLLAVLIVWGVVVSGSKKQTKQVTLDTGGDKSLPDSGASDIPPPLTPAPAADPTGSAPAVAPLPDPTPAPAAPATPAASASSPQKDWAALMTGKITLDPAPEKTETPAPAAAPSSSAQLPPSLIASDMTPGSQSVAAPAAPSPADPPAASSASATPVPAAPAASDPPAPATPAVRTHTVQSGETFSSIARTVYGNARYYQQIAQANPKINPNRLRPGTVINLPDISGAKSSGKSDVPAAADPPAASSTSSAEPHPAAAPAVDSEKEYRVAAGDSLYRISMRLYGSGEEADHLYDLNKTTIGPDRAKLKVGTVLKIPAPPTVATASR